MYDGEGKITEQINGNGTSIEYEYYEARDWVSKITHYNGTTKIEEFTVEYDGGTETVGNISNVVELDTSEVDYTYDALYRLTDEERTGTGSYTKEYAYDVAGNVTDVDGASFATYTSANAFSSISSGTVSYHSSGLPSQIGIPGHGCQGFNFDPKGQITQQKECSGANTTNYIWDGHGRLSYRTGVLKIFSGDKLVGEISNGGTLLRSYTWGADGLAIQRAIGSSTTHYYHHGPQGETRHLTGSAGSITDSYRYTAYGETLYTSGSTENYHRYGGKYGYYTQGIAGLIFAGARQYQPYALAIFIEEIS